jgi:hypothetical protein
LRSLAGAVGVLSFKRESGGVVSVYWVREDLDATGVEGGSHRSRCGGGDLDGMAVEKMRKA